MEVDDIPIEVIKVEDKGCKWSLAGSGVLYIFGYLLLLFVGAFLILWLIQPVFVMNQAKGQIDWGKLALSSFIFALLGVIIIWIVMSCSSK